VGDSGDREIGRPVANVLIRGRGIVLGTHRVDLRRASFSSSA
jgi:hypothetical protein